MTLTYTGSTTNGVYINNNFVTIAESADLVNILLEAGATFLTTPDLSSVGLDYDILGDPQFITGDPIGAYGLFTISITGPEDLFLEVIEPTFDWEQEACSALVTITDTLELANPAFDGRGRITYSIQIDGSWIELGSVSRGNSLQFNGCDYDFGTFNIKAVYTVREIPNCGGTSPIIFQADYTEAVTVVEFRPELSLVYEVANPCAGGTCCGATVDHEVTVTPTFDTNKDTGDSTLTWTLYDIEGEVIGTPTEITIPNADPTSVDSFFTFTPTEKSDYRVVAELDNGCEVCTKEIIISSCDYLTINPVLDGCNSYTLSNCSLTEDHTYTLMTISGTVIGTAGLPLLANTTTTVDLPEDGVYYVIIYNDDDSILTNFVIVGFCDVLACLTSKFNAVLCNTESCETVNQKRYELTRILPTAYLFFSYVHKEYSLNTAYELLNEAKILELQTLDNVIDKLTEFCGDCGTSTESGCGCH